MTLDRSTMRAIAILVTVACAMMVGAFGIHEYNARRLATTPTPGAVAAAPAPTSPQDAPTFAERAEHITTLSAALELWTPTFKDGVGQLDPQTGVFAVWCAKHLDWAALRARPETLHGLVMKDPEAQAGKRLCPVGLVSEIEVDRTAGTPIYVGGMVDDTGLVYRFLAVRSTVGIIANQRAKFCGIVTGRAIFQNLGGGTTKAAQLVGMFDIPANTGAKR